jgi:steroid delta-isomerase-like uncharacterized protein
MVTLRWIGVFGMACALAHPAFAGETAAQRKAVARRVFEEIFNQGRFEVASEIYAKDFVNHGATRDVGLKEDQDAARGWKSAFPDLKMSVEMMIAEGSLVTVLWRGEGTNTGEGNGLPATGKRLAGRGITIWRIEGGKIREEWSEFDQMRIMTQLGLLPEQK